MRKQYFEVHILEMACGYLDNRTYHFFNKKALEDEIKDIIMNYEENYNEPISISIFYFDEIEIGRDGLIIQKGYAKGLLLPQVATENAFTTEEFLEHTCMKAGISADSWMDESCDVFKFQGQIFK
jgi:uncharacterized protein (TIGR00296 family)